MMPTPLPAAWYRRFYEMTFLLSLFLVTLFVLNMSGASSAPREFRVDLVAGIGALLALGGSIAAYVYFDKVKSSYLPSLVIYGLIALSIAWTMSQSGNSTSSPFIALWALVSFAAPLFSAVGWVGILAISGISIATLYISGAASTGSLLVVIMSSLLPLVGGILVWRERAGGIDEETKNVKNLASELSEVATKSEIVINAIGDGVIAIDGKGVIELINPAAQEILGWGKQDALMLNYKSILKLNDENNHELDAARDPIQQVLNNNQQTRANKLTALTQSGKRINLSVVVSPIGDPGSGVITVFRDVTKERAEEHEQAEFISTASHEMRTPVASIEGYLGLALNPNTATIDERGKDYIMKAHEAAQHLGHLFQDLLDVSKSEDGRMTSLPRVVDMAQFTETITQGLTQKAQEKGLRLIFKPNENEGQKKIMPVLYVNQDNDHIREIIDNLIENGIKYTPKGEVSVDVEGTDDKVIISVKDSGLGIPTEDLSHLFQKFYRVDNIDRQQIGGTGLGLYLSRRLAEAMQGRLWVESVYGKGSTFYLELPRVSSLDVEALKEQQASDTAINARAAAQPIAQPEAPSENSPAPEQAQASNTTATDNTQAAAPAARAATTVPRGESLTREQIADRVRQLEELAKQQREAPADRQET